MSDNARAWDQFESYMRRARERMEDTWAPVALVCVQATSAVDGGTDLKLWNDSAVLWPADFPVKERGPLLARLAKPYADGTVLRS